MAWVTKCPKCGHNRVYNHDAGTCYVCTPKTGPAPKEERMEPHGSRRDEVEAKIISADCEYCDSAWIGPESLRYLARTLANEVDELRGKLDDIRMNIGCARGQRTTQYCAEAAARDEIIGKLLKMLEPGEKPNCMDPKYNPSKMPPLTEYNLDCMWREMRKQTHAAACEIAGRKPE